MKLLQLLPLSPPFLWVFGPKPPPGGIPSGATVGAALENAFALLPALRLLVSTPQLWHIEADYSVSLPWAAYFTNSSQRELTTGTPYVANHVIQWTFAANTAQQAAAIAQAFSQAWPNGFDRAPLVVAGTPVAIAQFEDDGFSTIGEGKGPDGQDCYLHVMMYEVMLATNRV